MGSAGSSRIGLDRVGSDPTLRIDGSDRIGSDRIGSDRIGSDRIGSDRIGSSRVDLGAVGAHRYHRPAIHDRQQTMVDQLKSTILATIRQSQY